MKISLVIPTLRLGDKLSHALRSMEGEYDELIIIDDKLDNLGKKINMGIERSTGDFVVISNDDVYLVEGHLKDLCDTNSVTAPRVNGNWPSKVFHAHMECFPREILNEGIRWPEDYDGYYWDDSDTWMQLITKGISPRIELKVNIIHDHPGWTLGQLGDNSERMEKNRQKFIDRWGVQALHLTGNV